MPGRPFRRPHRGRSGCRPRGRGGREHGDGSADDTIGHMPDPDPRFTMANERTFLAWNRTALAFIAGGLAVEQLVHAGRAGRLLVSIPLIVLGGAIGVAGY